MSGRISRVVETSVPGVSLVLIHSTLLATLSVSFAATLVLLLLVWP